MIFSNKIYKINDGQNPTLFQQDKDTLNLFLYNKSLKKYKISTNNKKNCVFSDEYNYKKIIQLSNTAYCPCNEEFITKINECDL
jgi:hypothetical protein